MFFDGSIQKACTERIEKQFNEVILYPQLIQPPETSSDNPHPDTLNYGFIRNHSSSYQEYVQNPEHPLLLEEELATLLAEAGILKRYSYSGKLRQIMKIALVVLVLLSLTLFFCGFPLLGVVSLSLLAILALCLILTRKKAIANTAKYHHIVEKISLNHLLQAQTHFNEVRYLLYEQALKIDWATKKERFQIAILHIITLFAKQGRTQAAKKEAEAYIKSLS